MTPNTGRLSDERLKVQRGPFKGKPQQWFTRAEVIAILATLPSGIEADEAEFEVHCSGDYAASACGPREQAWAEIMRYAAQYQQDGPVVIYEVRRIPVLSPTSPPNGKTEGDGNPSRGGEQ